MGKLRLRGPVPPDDPMFSGGVQLFSQPNAGADVKSGRKPSPAFSEPFIRLQIDWEGDKLALDLTAEDWERVRKGKNLIIEVLDDNDDVELRWLLNSEPDHTLIVDYGDPNHLRWLGQLEDAIVVRELPKA